MSNTPYSQHDEAVALLKLQQQQKYQPLNFNGIEQYEQNYGSADYERPLYAANKQHEYFKACEQQKQQKGIDDIYHVAKQKYM